MLRFVALAACGIALADATKRSIRGNSEVAKPSASLVNEATKKIEPDLWPKSDKAFFGHDYPHDMQPRKLHSFDHPHPVVQESDEYDTDYPKDENSDSGEWKAQFTYDTLRSKIHAAKNLERMRKQMLEEAEAAMRKAAEEEKEAVQKAETLRNEAEHEEQVKAAKERSKEWAKQKAREDAEGAAAAAGNRSSGESTDVESAMKQVEGEMKDLEDCKKKLKEAQDQLKETMERSQKGKAALEDIKAKTAEEIAAQEKAEKEAEALAAAKEKEKAEQEAKAKEQAEIHEQAKKEWSLTTKELKEMEDKLKDAEKRLRSFRHKQVTPGGGIYDAPDEKKYDPCEGCPPKTSMASQGDSLAVSETERISPSDGTPSTHSAACRSAALGFVGIVALTSALF